MQDINTQLFFYVQHLAGVSPALDTFFLFITNPFIFIILGGFSIWIVFVRPFLSRDPSERLRALEEALFFVAVMSLIWFVVAIVKAMVVFPRPHQYFYGIRTLLLYGDFDSFPSLHAAFSFALATIVFTRKRLLGGTLFVAAALVAFTRVYVGVHFPIDVIVGGAIGVLIPWGVHLLTKRHI